MSSQVVPDRAYASAAIVEASRSTPSSGFVTVALAAHKCAPSFFDVQLLASEGRSNFAFLQKACCLGMSNSHDASRTAPFFFQPPVMGPNPIAAFVLSNTLRAEVWCQASSFAATGAGPQNPLFNMADWPWTYTLTSATVSGSWSRTLMTTSAPQSAESLLCAPVWELLKVRYTSGCFPSWLNTGIGLPTFHLVPSTEEGPCRSQLYWGFVAQLAGTQATSRSRSSLWPWRSTPPMVLSRRPYTRVTVLEDHATPVATHVSYVMRGMYIYIYIYMHTN